MTQNIQNQSVATLGPRDREDETSWKDCIDPWRAEAAPQILDGCLSGRVQKNRWVVCVGGVQTRVPGMWEKAEMESFVNITHRSKKLTHNGYLKIEGLRLVSLK